MNTKGKCSCYTFYSYKGGSGRSTTLINTIPHLIRELGATPEEPILLVDADLESAGITYYFDCASKFSDQFLDSINTAKLLLGSSKKVYFGNSEKADTVFGSRSGAQRVVGRGHSISKDVLEKLEKINVGVDKTLFEGLKFTPAETHMLGRIADVFLIKENEEDENPDYKYFKRMFPLAAVLRKMKDADNNADLSQEEKISKKQKLIEDMLPTDTLVDVSAFFDAPPMTVRFLGADTRSKDSSVVPREEGAGEGDIDKSKATSQIIRSMILTCRARKYKAIIFDSASGTQNTPHILHSASDVIVYCMRPTRQFRNGTETQLRKYQDVLERNRSANKKKVVLLPTAVPADNQISLQFREENFEKIEGIVGAFSNIVDGSFCNSKDCLNEVQLFKWYEMILGTSNAGKDAHDERVAPYRNVETLPQDALNAYHTYENLAKAMIRNTEFEDE